MNFSNNVKNSEELSRLARDNDIRFEKDSLWLSHYRDKSNNELHQEWKKWRKKSVDINASMQNFGIYGLKLIGGTFGIVILLRALWVGLNNSYEGLLSAVIGGILILVAVHAERSAKQGIEYCHVHMEAIAAVCRERGVNFSELINE